MFIESTKDVLQINGLQKKRFCTTKPFAGIICTLWLKGEMLVDLQNHALYNVFSSMQRFPKSILENALKIWRRDYIIKMHFLDITTFPQAFLTSVLNESLNPLWFALPSYLNSIKSFWLRRMLLFLKYWDIANGMSKGTNVICKFVIGISKGL